MRAASVLFLALGFFVGGHGVINMMTGNYTEIDGYRVSLGFTHFLVALYSHIADTYQQSHAEATASRMKAIERVMKVELEYGRLEHDFETLKSLTSDLHNITIRRVEEKPKTFETFLDSTL